MQNRNGSQNRASKPREFTGSSGQFLNNQRAPASKPNNGPTLNERTQQQYQAKVTTTVKMGFGEKSSKPDAMAMSKASSQPTNYGRAPSDKMSYKQPAFSSMEDDWEEIQNAKDTSASIIDELKQEVRDLKQKLEAKDMQILNYRSDNTRLRKEQFDSKAKMMELKLAVAEMKEKSSGSALQRAGAEATGSGRQISSQQAAMQALERGFSGGNGEATEYERQIQMALQMEEMQRERKARSEIMMMMALQSQGRDQAQMEDDRLLQAALEESKKDIPNDPSSPDVDNMTYEQLIDMGDKAGKVSKGLSKAEIARIETRAWYKGKTKTDSCTICMDNFTSGQKYKKLKCNHEFHADCVDQWLKNENKCPICQGPVV